MESVALEKPEDLSQGFRYRSFSPALLKKSTFPCESYLVPMMLTKEIDPALPKKTETFFGPHRLPGTAPIGARIKNPLIFQDTVHDQIVCYDDWLRRIVHQIVSELHPPKSVNGENLSVDAAQEFFLIVQALLELRSFEGVPLKNLIPQQTYEDTLRHMIMMVCRNSADTTASEPYAGFNAVCRRIALATLGILASEKQLSIGDDAIARLIHISVLSGYVGINLKSTASAASELLNRDLIPVDRDWAKSVQSAEAIPVMQIQDVARQLIDTSRQYDCAYGLDSISSYFSEVIDTDTPTLLIFFSDDYLESIIDMKRFELLLERNRLLTILMVPRNGRYGNDLANEDVDGILKEPIFEGLNRFRKQHRFIVSGNGPRGGCIDPRFLSGKLLLELEHTVALGKRPIIETKGCRNFEMLKGPLPIPWYAAFNCNRALSIRTVGIDMDPVFIRIAPGLCAFDKFDMPRIGDTPSGTAQGVRFARMTTWDLFQSLSRKRYREFMRRHATELDGNRALMKLCDQTGLTLPELIRNGNFHETENRSA